MDRYHVALYIHFISLLIGIGAASVLTICAFQLRAARTLADAAPWGRVAAKVGRVFPIAILGLFGSGAYMTSQDIWTWDAGWIEVGIGALVVLAIQGPLIAERAGTKIAQALMNLGQGKAFLPQCFSPIIVVQIVGEACRVVQRPRPYNRRSSFAVR